LEKRDLANSDKKVHECDAMEALYFCPGWVHHNKSFIYCQPIAKQSIQSLQSIKPTKSLVKKNLPINIGRTTKNTSLTVCKKINVYIERL